MEGAGTYLQTNTTIERYYRSIKEQVLCRTQRYGANAKASAYFSRDPLDFGVDQDEGRFVCTLPIAAPEIIKYGGQYYVAALLPSLKGIRISGVFGSGCHQ
jgi:hypothetical protein